jgi:hypothetical protein
MDMWNCAIANQVYDWSLEDQESIGAMRERLARVGPAFLREVRGVVADGRLCQKCFAVDVCRAVA